MLNFIEPLGEEDLGIYFVRGEANARYPYSNALLIGSYLIDTGIGSKRIRKIKKEFYIKQILLSHWHEDHISGNRLFNNAKFAAHKDDIAPIENVSKMTELYGVKGTNFENEFEKLIKVLRIENTKDCQVLEPNSIVKMDDQKGIKVKIIHTPGHTAGHCIFLEESTRIAYLGDIDLSSFPFYGSVDANLVNLIDSIEIVLKLDIKIAVTGHKDVFFNQKIINDKLKLFKQEILNRDRRILENLSETRPMNSQNLKNKNIIYKKYSDFKDYELIAERLMIKKHLLKLLKQGLIVEQEDGYILV